MQYIAELDACQVRATYNVIENEIIISDIDIHEPDTGWVKPTDDDFEDFSQRFLDEFEYEMLEGAETRRIP